LKEATRIGWATVNKTEKSMSDLTKSLNDLFQSELRKGDDASVLTCPHCDHGISKADVIAKARGGGGGGGLPGRSRKTDEPEVQNSATGSGGNARFGAAPKPHAATKKSGKKVPKTSPAYPKNMKTFKSEDGAADDDSSDPDDGVVQKSEEAPPVRRGLRGTQRLNGSRPRRRGDESHER
jgi:hypothetical protein